jgi:hypothetical protein
LPSNITHGIPNFVHIEDGGGWVAVLPTEVLEHVVEGLYLVWVDPIDASAVAISSNYLK